MTCAVFVRFGSDCFKSCPDPTYSVDETMTCVSCEDKHCVNCDQSQCYWCQEGFYVFGDLVFFCMIYFCVSFCWTSVCLQTASVWTTVNPGSSWIRRVRTASRVTEPVEPAEGLATTTATPAKRGSCWRTGSVWSPVSWRSAPTHSSGTVRTASRLQAFF